jgi:transposase-like protein
MPLIQKRERSALAQCRSIRWTARYRAAVVLAVVTGRLSLSEVERRYGISIEEFFEWQRRASRTGRSRSAVSG